MKRLGLAVFVLVAFAASLAVAGGGIDTHQLFDWAKFRFSIIPDANDTRQLGDGDPADPLGATRKGWSEGWINRIYGNVGWFTAANDTGDAILGAVNGTLALEHNTAHSQIGSFGLFMPMTYDVTAEDAAYPTAGLFGGTLISGTGTFSVPARGVAGKVAQTAARTVNWVYALVGMTPSRSAGTWDNYAGLYLEASGNPATNNFGVYQAGTEINRFFGPVQAKTLTAGVGRTYQVALDSDAAASKSYALSLPPRDPTSNNQSLTCNTNGTCQFETLSTTQTKSAYFTVAGTLAASPGQLRWYPPAACTLVSAFASVGTAPTGASATIDIKKNGGSSVLGAALTIAASANTSTVDTPTTTAMLVTDYLTMDVATVGSTEPGKDLSVRVIYTVP